MIPKTTFKHIKTGEIYDLVSFTVTLDGIGDLIVIKNIENNKILTIPGECFQKQYVRLYGR